MSVIEKSWYKKPGLLSILLLPLSLLFWFISTLRALFYKLNIKLGMVVVDLILSAGEMTSSLSAMKALKEKK